MGLLSKSLLQHCCVLICCLAMVLCASPARADVWSHLDGNSRDVQPSLAGPVYNLGGGGADVDRALQWMIDQVRRCENCSSSNGSLRSNRPPGQFGSDRSSTHRPRNRNGNRRERNHLDMVVLRFLSDDDQAQWEQSAQPPDVAADYLGYHALLPSNRLASSLRGLDSIETFVFSNPARQDADRADVAEAIAQAEVVFFAGGDQCNYTRNFKGTAVEAAIESVQRRGGAVGGTSAGAMIQGEWIFNACSDTLTSEGALADPYEDILLTNPVFPWRALQGTIIDTHFYQRDRMGRALAFIARLLRDGMTDRALAVAIDENTSLVVNRRGRATVMSDDKDGSVYFIWGDHQPQRCEPQQPLSLADYPVWRIRDGESFDLRRIPARGDYRVSVDNGVILPANPYRGS